MPATQQQHRPDVRHVDPVKALTGAFLILETWGASAEQARVLLGAPAERTFFSWKAGRAVRVPSDTLRRVGYLAGIYKALHIVYADRTLADGWVHRANAAFGGQTPMQRMLGGDVTDLAAVRAYVDAARAPWS
jgi:hypothetical protein